MTALTRIHVTQKPTCPWVFLLRIYSPNIFKRAKSAAELLFCETSQKHYYQYLVTSAVLLKW